MRTGRSEMELADPVFVRHLPAGTVPGAGSGGGSGNRAIAFLTLRAFAPA
jgi:hypothetical protein